ncbi:hypothetical protein GCM10027060_06170 [Nesterenkonia halophila]
MTPPAVTVVVPCWEAGATLPATLESLRAQSFADLEILVVDDGSARDPVREVPADPRIVVDRRPVNGGYAAVTNHAVRRARGRWVTFVDADDVVAPGYVETMLAAGRRHDADLVLAPLMAVRGGREIGALPFAVDGEVISAQEACRRAVRGQLVLSQHALFRRPTPEAVEGFTFNDFIMILDHLARSRRVALVHEPLYRYVVHGRSMTGSLRASVWELRDLPAHAAPAIAALFGPDQVPEVHADLEQYVVTQMLHKASRDGGDSPLSRDVHAWCRRRIGPRGIWRALRRGDVATAGSWLLALCGRSAHILAYRAYDRRKSADR